MQLRVPVAIVMFTLVPFACGSEPKPAPVAASAAPATSAHDEPSVSEHIEPLLPAQKNVEPAAKPVLPTAARSMASASTRSTHVRALVAESRSLCAKGRAQLPCVSKSGTQSDVEKKGSDTSVLRGVLEQEELQLASLEKQSAKLDQELAEMRDGKPIEPDWHFDAVARDLDERYYELEERLAPLHARSAAMAKKLCR